MAEEGSRSHSGSGFVLQRKAHGQQSVVPGYPSHENAAGGYSPVPTAGASGGISMTEDRVKYSLR